MNEISALQKYINNLVDDFERGAVAVVISEVDRWALEFYQRIVKELDIVSNGKYQRLKGTLKLEPYITGSRSKNRRYGYWVRWEGSDDDDVPLQLIANVLNAGREAGSKAVTTQGMHGAVSVRLAKWGAIPATTFMTRQLEVLKNIDTNIINKLDFGKWVITPEHIILSDGTKLTNAEIDRLLKKEAA